MQFYIIILYLYLISYHIVSYHIVSYCVISYRIILYPLPWQTLWRSPAAGASTLLGAWQRNAIQNTPRLHAAESARPGTRRRTEAPPSALRCLLPAACHHDDGMGWNGGRRSHLGWREVGGCSKRNFTKLSFYCETDRKCQKTKVYNKHGEKEILKED